MFLGYFILFYLCGCVYFPIALLCFLLTFYVLSYVTARMILPTYFLDMHLLVFVLFSMLCGLDGQIDSLFAIFFFFWIGHFISFLQVLVVSNTYYYL